DRLTVMLPNGTTETRSVLTVNGSAIRVSEDFSLLPQRESVWVVESDEVAAQKFRVMSVEESGELEFTITAMEYAEGKFAEIEQGIKWEEPSYTSLPPKVQAPPTNITIDLREYAGEIVAGSAVTVSWEKVAGAVKYLVEWRQGDGS